MNRIVFSAWFNLGSCPRRSPLTLTLSPAKPEERGQEKSPATQGHRRLNQANYRQAQAKLVEYFGTVKRLSGLCLTERFCPTERRVASRKTFLRATGRIRQTGPETGFAYQFPIRPESVGSRANWWADWDSKTGAENRLPGG